MRVRFEDCLFDSEVRELRRGGRVIALSPKAFQLLSLLLESHPRPLPERDLRDALWPDTSVGYTSLAQVVAAVRKAIGDTTRPARLVRTVPRFGYVFTGRVADETARPSVGEGSAFVARDREYGLPDGETLVGRGEECGVRLISGEVSRVHARIRVAGDVVTVEDAGSKNGTWVNGERRPEATSLADGDEVLFGTFRVVFRRGGTPGSTRTGKPR